MSLLDPQNYLDSLDTLGEPEPDKRQPGSDSDDDGYDSWDSEPGDGLMCLSIRWFPHPKFCLQQRIFRAGDPVADQKAKTRGTELGFWLPCKGDLARIKGSLALQGPSRP